MSQPLITVTQSSTYLALAISGAEVRAFIYNSLGQHSLTLGVATFTGDTPQPYAIYLLDPSSLELFVSGAGSLGQHKFYNWPASGSTFETADTSGEPDYYAEGTYWSGAPGGAAIYQWRGAITSPSSVSTGDLNKWSTDADAGTLVDSSAAIFDDGWEGGGTEAPLGTPTPGGILVQLVAHDAGAGAQSTAKFAIHDGSLMYLHTGTVSVINSSVTGANASVRRSALGDSQNCRGGQTAYGGISLVDDIAGGSWVVAHLPRVSDLVDEEHVSATGPIVQTRLTPVSWAVSSGAAGDVTLHVSPDGSAFVWYDSVGKTFVRHSTNPAEAITEGDSLAARQVAVEDGPGGHAIDVLIPLN